MIKNEILAVNREPDELAEYLISKGADDSILNADGLTCYEGLSMGVVEGI